MAQSAAQKAAFKKMRAGLAAWKARGGKHRKKKSPSKNPTATNLIARVKANHTVEFWRGPDEHDWTSARMNAARFKFIDEAKRAARRLNTKCAVVSEHETTANILRFLLGK